MYESLNLRALGLSLTASQTLDLAAETGFRGVDLLVRDLVEAGDDPRALRARMDDLGLRGGAFPMPVNWRGEESEFVSALEALAPLAEAAATLGLQRTATWVMPETTLPWQATIDLHVDRLGRLARRLDGFGIRLGLEVIGVETFRNRGGVPFVHRMAVLDAVLGAVWAESPNLGILADAYHLHAAEEDASAPLAWGVERVVWVHLADLPADFHGDRAEIRDDDRGLPGEHGAVNNADLLARLAHAGYDGPVTAEPMPGCRSLRGLSPPLAARKVRTALQSVWPNP